MKKIYLLAIGLFAAAGTMAQENVGIGTAAPDKSAILDLNSSNKGLLMPRMNLQERNQIPSPAKGLLVFQTDNNSGFYYFNGNSWSPMTSEDAKSVSAAGAGPAWTEDGNAALSTSFLGTSNNFPLVFKVNGISSGFISPTNTSMYFGYKAGLAATSGSANLGIGSQAMESVTTGSSNTGLGYFALNKLTTGLLNMAVGGFSLSKITTGNGNVALGHGSLVQNLIGSDNIAIGADALFNTTASENVGIGRAALTALTTGSGNFAIGKDAGRFLTTGNNNVLIGNYAGYNETIESGKLYIANSPTTTPLIYGDFSAKYVTIGDVTPSQRNQGVATGGYNLLVKGGILTEKVKVAVATTGDWADYVFEPTYKLMSLENVEQFTKDNNHLPNVPSADQLAKDGLDLGQTSKMFMEKIEELTLYVIEMNKEIKALKAENAKLKK